MFATRPRPAAPHGLQHNVLQHAADVVTRLSQASPEAEPDEQAVEQLRSAVYGLKSSAQSAKLSSSDVDNIWAMSTKLWNYCVDCYNSRLNKQRRGDDAIAWLRRFACDILDIIPDDLMAPAERICKLTFFFKSGRAWQQLDRHEEAEVSLASAAQHMAGISDVSEDIISLKFDILQARLQSSWALKQHALSTQLLQALTSMLSPDNGIAPHICASLSCMLSEQLIEHSMTSINASRGSHTDGSSAVPVLDEAYRLAVLARDMTTDDAIKHNTIVLQAKALLWLAYSHIFADNNAQAGMTCLAQLKQMPGAEGIANRPVSLVVSLKACLLAGQQDQAVTELMAMVTNDATQQDMCVAAVVECLQAKLQLAQLLPALQLLQERFPNDASITLRLTKVVLEHPQAVREADEEIILHQLDSSDLLKAQCAEDPALSSECFKLLWTHATFLFDNRQFPRAIPVYNAAMEFASSAQEKARAARTVGLCYLGLQDYARAESALQLSAKLLPHQMSTTFMQFKILLLRSDTDAALECLQDVAASAEFTPEILQACCQEALASKTWHVAREALKQLHAIMVDINDNNDGSKVPASYTSEASILRNLIKGAQDHYAATAAKVDPGAVAAAAKAGPEAPGGDPAVAATIAMYKELQQYFKAAYQRLRALGMDAFFGQKDTKAIEGLEWLVYTSWNVALEASDMHHFETTTVLMIACATLLECHPSPSTKQLCTRKVAFLMAATAALEVHNSRGDADNHRSLQLARQMLESSKAAGREMLARPDGHAYVDVRVDVQIAMQEFQVATRMQDSGWQATILQSSKSLEGMSADTLMKMALMCKEGPNKNTEVAASAYHLALHRLLASPCPKFDHVAHVVRTLIQMTNVDGEKLALFREVAGVLAGVQQGTYPSRELEWLVSNCWNRGCHHNKFSRHAEAEQFLALSVQLLRFCPAMESRHRGMMEKELAKTTAARAKAEDVGNVVRVLDMDAVATGGRG